MSVLFGFAMALPHVLGGMGGVSRDIAGGHTRDGRVSVLGKPLFGGVLLFTLPLTTDDLLRRLFGSISITMINRFMKDETLTTIKDGTPIVKLLVGLFVNISVKTYTVVSGRVKRRSSEDVHGTVDAIRLITLLDKFFLLMLKRMTTQPVLA